MFAKNKNEKQKSMTSNLLTDKTNISQKIKENLSSSCNVSNYTVHTPKEGKKKKLNQFSKKVQFSSFSPVHLKSSLKRKNCSYSTFSKLAKPFSTLSLTNKSLKYLSIKSLENYIKQKILNMSMKLEKDDANFSEIENYNNCNFTMPSISMSKIIKKFPSGSGHESSSNKKDDKKKISSQSSYKKSIKNISHKKEFSKNTREKIYRKIERKKIVYDSIDDSDIYYERDKINFFIPSDSSFALIFDSLIILFTLFDVIYTPFRISLSICFCMDIYHKIKYIYIFMDMLYISDLVFSFFRTQYDEDLKIIKENEIITKNYITNQFTSDFLEAIPMFSFISYLCKNNNDYCIEYSFNFKRSLLLFFCYFKQLKLIKIIDRKKNSLTNKILDIIANKHNIEKKYKMIKWIIIIFYAIYTFISIHVYIGHQSYPNWIVSMNLQNKNYFQLYITSFYFLMATVSTVGYGDIVCKSTLEICIQVIFLAVGVCVYSFIITIIGNYVSNQDRAIIKYNKDEELLEEIRIEYPEMPFKLYNQILKHLISRRIRQQKCEVNILINSLPFSLRNNLLLTMYKQTTNRLKICKNCSNSDFIIKLLTNFIPLFSKKNGLIIYEGELIDSIVFVNDGRLALEASIDMEFPEHSIYQYLYLKFIDINEAGGSTAYMDSSSTCSHAIPQNFIDYRRAESILDKAINSPNFKNSVSGKDETSIGKQVGKYDYGENFDENNYKYINIINILKNESYGSVYMFLNKPSPLSLRVKSKKADLFLLRKFDAFAISRLHSNIWKRYQRKAYLNMNSIKNLAIKIIKDYSKNNNIVPIKPKSKRIGSITLHDSDNNSYNYKDFNKTNTNFIKYLSNSSSNHKVKTNTFSLDKELDDKLEYKDQHNDFVTNINKVLNNKKDDNINEYQNKEINLNLNNEINKELNNELIIETKKIENNDNPKIIINRINPEDQNTNIKNSNISNNKSNFSSVNNLDDNRWISCPIITKRRRSCINENTAVFGLNEKKSTNLDQNHQNESKKGLSSLNSGINSFLNKDKKTDKKNLISGNEKTENKSEYIYTFGNHTNQEFKSSNFSNIPSSINIKRPRIHKNSFLIAKENKQKNRLSSVGKIRFFFVRKLKKKIKLLKAEKKKYKNLSKSLNHDLNEFVKKQAAKIEDTKIKDIKILNDAENKEIINDTENEKINQISNKNNIINNITVQNNNNFLVHMPEFSSTESSEISSNTYSRSFDLNEISISPTIGFTFKSKYKNLNVISLGYYSKSKKLRKSIRNIINEFLSVKKQIHNEEEQKNIKKENINKGQKMNSSKSDSLNGNLFHVYTDNISENEKKSNHKIFKKSQNNSYIHDISNDMKQINSIHIYKKYKNDENIENIINGNNYDNNYCNNCSRDNNFFNLPKKSEKNQSENNKNIIKLKNLNFLNMSSSQKPVNSIYNKNKEKNYLVMNNYKQKKCSNMKNEYEHIFSKNIINGNLNKSCSLNKDKNLIKINNINSFIIRNSTKYLMGNKMKIEDVDEPVNHKSINNSNKNNKNKIGGAISSNNNNYNYNNIKNNYCSI